MSVQVILTPPNSYAREASIVLAIDSASASGNDLAGFNFVLSSMSGTRVVRLPERTYFRKLDLNPKSLDRVQLETSVIYEYDVNDPVISEPQSDLETSPSPKRIALVVPLPEQVRKIHKLEGNWIQVISIYWLRNTWNLCPTSCFVQLCSDTVAQQKPTLYKLLIIDLLTDTMTEARKSFGEDLCDRAAANDLWEEVDTVLKVLTSGDVC